MNKQHAYQLDEGYSNDGRASVLTSRPTALRILASSGILGLLLTTFASATETLSAEQVPFDNALYAEYLGLAVESVPDLISAFESIQYSILPIVLPDPDFIHLQDGGLLPFDPDAFPSRVVRRLIPINDQGITVYPVTIIEVPDSGERQILNIAGDVIAEVRAPKNYDPLWYVRLRFPDLDTLDAETAAWQIALYDPSRIMVRFRLITEEELIKKVMAESLAVQQLLTALTFSPLSLSYPASGLAFESLSVQTNGIVDVTMIWPSGSLASDGMDIFSCTNLMDQQWSILLTTNVNNASGSFAFTAPAAGDGEKRFLDAWTHYDGDGDELYDGREVRLYGTDRYDADTDADGMPDGWEMQNGFDPLNATDAQVDADGDGLTNLGEYQAGTDPHDSDTDNDDMLDGWEVQFALAPLNAGDAEEDPDGDGYLTIYEYVHASNPQVSASIPAPTLTVNTNQSIQAAINTITNDYGIIQVLPGTYTGSGNRNLSFNGKRITLISGQGAANTIIDAQGAARGFTITSNETRRTVVSGFTIQNGNANVVGFVYGNGGAILTYDASPTIINSVLRLSDALLYGGGFHAHAGSPAIRNCTINANTAGTAGGGVACNGNSTLLVAKSVVSGNVSDSFGGGLSTSSSSPILNDVTLSENVADGFGGGCYFDGSSAPLFNRCLIAHNESGEGGGIYSKGSSTPEIHNTIISRNRADLYDGGIASVGGGVDIRNSVIADNHALYSGGGGSFESSDTIVNSIIRGNTADAFWGYNQIYSWATNATMHYSNVELEPSETGVWPGEGNINEAPRFTRLGYRLTQDSPCIGTGTANGAPANDIDGEERCQSNDMGIDQFVDSNSSGMADVWEILHFGGVGIEPPHGDYDDDGLTNLLEYEQSTDPTNPDTSGNGFHDGWLFIYGYDPLDPDVIDPCLDDDSDGLSNWQEFLLGSNPGSANTSGNAYTDLEQFEMGFSPVDPMDGTGSDWFLVTGDLGMGAVKTNFRSYTIPAGETWRFDVTLHSEEYPDYTGGQSQYNDLLSWSFVPSQGQGLSGSIDVNSRHQHWVTAEQEERTLLGFDPVHLEDALTFRAPELTDLVVSVTITAKNVADGILPSTVIIYPRPNPPLENTADETESHNPADAMTRDPINVINGNVTLSERDLFIPAPGIPLAFSRHYHSRGALDAGSPLGGGWRHTYDLYLASRTNATYKGIAGDWMVLSTPDGQRHWFREDNGGWLSPPENNLRLTQTGSDFRVESPGGIRHDFDANGILQAISDTFGNTVTLSYAGTWPSQTLSRVEHANGQFLDFASSDGRITAITTPSTNLAVSLQYSASGLLTNAVRHISGTDAVFAYRYDPVHSVLTQCVNAVGHRFDYGYDFEAPDGPRGSAMQLEGQYYAHTINYTNQGPNRTEVTYDRDGQPQAFVYAYDATRKTISGIYGPNSMDYGKLLARDENMNVTGETLFDSILGEYLITGREFDNRNNVIAESIGYNAPPATQRWHYVWHEDWNLPTETIDPMGHRTEFSYTNGLLAVTREFPATNLTSETHFAYTASGLLSSVTNANGHWVRFEHDSLGFVTSSVLQAGPTVNYSYNTLGHLNAIILPGASGTRVTSMVSDGQGRVSSVTYPGNLSESFTYDRMGNLTNHTDTAGRATLFSYAPAGKLATVTRGSGVEEVTISFDYDQQFNTLTIKDALDREVETYTLDIQDRPIVISNVENQTMSAVYGVGDIVHCITRFDGTTVSNSYDSSARLVGVNWPDASTTFSYYDNGLLKTVSSESGTVSNAYDQANRLTSISSEFSVLSVVNSYSLDGIGNATNIQVSIDGSTVLTNSYTFDAAERVSAINGTGGTFAFNYGPYNGLVAGVSNTTSGIRAEYQFDDLDRLTNIVWRNAANSILRSFAYGFNNAGMITNVTRETAAENVAYGYDSLDRLTSASASYLAASYGWDLVGNPSSRTENGTNTSYTLGTGNKLVSWTGGSYGHDSAGCVTNITRGTDTLSLSWNSRYNLTSIATNGAVAEAYTYGPLGNRITTVLNGVTNHHVYEGAHCVADLAADGELLRSYQPGPGVDNWLSMTVHTGATPVVYTYLTDHLGTVHAVADATGAIVESYRYDPHGKVLDVRNGSGTPLTESAIGNRILWQGREYSWATGLYYFRSRYYDPQTARWLSKDKIGISGGINLYQALSDNPVMFRDPWGLTSFFEVLFPVRGALARDVSLTGSTASDLDIAMQMNGIRGLASAGGIVTAVGPFSAAATGVFITQGYIGAGALARMRLIQLGDSMAAAQFIRYGATQALVTLGLVQVGSTYQSITDFVYANPQLMSNLPLYADRLMTAQDILDVLRRLYDLSLFWRNKKKCPDSM